MGPRLGFSLRDEDEVSQLQTSEEDTLSEERIIHAEEKSGIDLHDQLKNFGKDSIGARCFLIGCCESVPPDKKDRRGLRSQNPFWNELDGSGKCVDDIRHSVWLSNSG